IQTLMPTQTVLSKFSPRVLGHLHEHHDNEETIDLPALEPKLGIDPSQGAAKNFSRNKLFAPTR
ncbi:hypothetical protein BU17DRAFT_15811, partial [Hysterangium stoloniferum]